MNCVTGNPHCRNCAYRERFDSSDDFCAYVVYSGQLRGCPIEGCTRKDASKEAHERVDKVRSYIATHTRVIVRQKWREV